MKKFALAVCLLLPALMLSASANSSWVWISETRPYDVLPWVILLTLAVETVCLWRVPGIRRPGKVLGAVCLGNAASFALPYLLLLAHPVYSFAQALDGHWYTVGAAFLVVTLVVELPVEYLLLRGDTERRKTLLVTALAANVVTTLLVAVIERTVCRGIWA